MYTIYDVQAESDCALDDLDGFSHLHGGVYEFDYESDPMFGSPTQYSGVVLHGDDRLVIAPDVSNGQAKSIKRRLEDESTGEFETLNLDVDQQYALLKAHNGTITRVHHPEFPETRVSEIARLRELQDHPACDSDAVREEAAREQYPVLSATIRRDGDVVRVDFRSGCSFSRLPNANADVAAWVNQIISEAT